GGGGGQAGRHRDGPARRGPGRAAPRRPGRDAGSHRGASVPGGARAAHLRRDQRDPEARDRPGHPEGGPSMTVEVLREEDMSPEYRRMVVQLMESQAYRELAAAHMFGYGLRFVPDKWMKFMVWHIQEETEHYQAVAKMYRDFTKQEVEPRVR